MYLSSQYMMMHAATEQQQAAVDFFPVPSFPQINGKFKILFWSRVEMFKF